MSNRHSKKYLCLHFTLLAMCIVSENLVTALKCFEGSAENKSNSMRIASDDSWTLCVFSNSLDANSMPENKGGTLFGIGPDSEDLSPFEALLSIGQSSADPSYKILQICVLERYNIGALRRGKMSRRMKKSEHIFRCFCNYDLCNHQQTFDGHLKTIVFDENSK